MCMQVTQKCYTILYQSFPADHVFKASLLQRVEFTTHCLQRTLVLFCDSSFITNVTSETTSRIVLPSFSGIKYLSNGKIEIGLLLAIVMFSYKDPSKSRRSYRLRFQPSSTVEDFYRFCLLSTIRNDGTCTTSQRSLHSMGRSICNCRRSFPCCRSGIEELCLF
jgi:hypothetical protein